MAKRKQRRRTYKTGSIFKRGGSPTFTIKFRDKSGDTYTKQGFTTKEDATIALELALNQPVKSKNTPVLSVLVEKWLQARKNTHENWYCDGLRWEKHLKPTIGTMTPDEVATDTIKNIIDAKFAAGLKSGSVGLIVRLLSSIYSDLVEGPFATSNPAAALPKKTKRTLKSDHDPESVPFLHNLQEVGMVFATLPDDLKVPFAVGVYSGLRSGEIFGLDWSHIDLVNRKIRVVQQITPNGTIKPYPKDGDARTTIIPNALALILEDYKIKTGGVGRMFKHVGSAKLNKVLSSALASLQLRSMTFYQATRHSFASLWVLNGGSLEVLQKLLGHSSILVTQRYSHLKLDTFSQADLGRMDQKAA